MVGERAYIARGRSRSSESYGYIHVFDFHGSDDSKGLSTVKSPFLPFLHESEGPRSIREDELGSSRFQVSSRLIGGS